MRVLVNFYMGCEMLAKYINENTIQLVNKYEILKYDNVQVINPKDADFLNVGYKELVISNKPYYNQETEYLEPVYKEMEDKILQSWVIKQQMNKLYVEEIK